MAKGPKEKGRGKWGGKRGYNMRTKALKPQRANEKRSLSLPYRLGVAAECERTSKTHTRAVGAQPGAVCRAR